MKVKKIPQGSALRMFIAGGTVKNFEPFSFPVNTDRFPATGANRIAFITGINKPVYGGFFIGKPAVKLFVRHRADRSFRFISHFFISPFPKFFF
jgi:hypothetical protein